jgi:hypothetical protein
VVQRQSAQGTTIIIITNVFSKPVVQQPVAEQKVNAGTGWTLSVENPAAYSLCRRR